MSRTYPVNSPLEVSAGVPWGPRGTDTGNPTDGVFGYGILVVTGTPQWILTEEQTETLTGTPEEFDLTALILDGTDYQYEVQAGDTRADVVSALALLAAADPNYTVNADGDALDVISKTAGAWSGSISATYVPSDGGNGAWVNAVITAGADANIAAVDDGSDSYSHVVNDEDDNASIAANVAAQIALNPAYSSAVALGTTIYVTGADGTPFAFTDATTNNQSPGTTITYIGAVPGTGAVGVGSPGVQNLSSYGPVTVWAQLQSGTSFDLTVWKYDATLQLWAADAAVTVTEAVQIVQPNVQAISAMFCEMSNFVGGAIGLLSVEGVKTAPGFNS